MSQLKELEASTFTCPKCGGTGRITGEGFAKSVLKNDIWETYFTDRVHYRVVCEKCGATTRRVYLNEKNAVVGWNNDIIRGDIV